MGLSYLLESNWFLTDYSEMEGIFNDKSCVLHFILFLLLNSFSCTFLKYSQFIRLPTL